MDGGGGGDRRFKGADKGVDEASDIENSEHLGGVLQWV